MSLQIFPTDKAFSDSPFGSHPLCTCSRCRTQIKEQECVIRAWTTNEKGDVDGNSLEYRYCEKCQESMGIICIKPSYDNDDDPDFYGDYYQLAAFAKGNIEK